MSKTTIRMGHPHGQTPANVFRDFNWIAEHEKELLERYGECSIIVYDEHIIGTGASYAEALSDAETHAPLNKGEITPVHHWLRRRNPILRVRAVDDSTV